MRPLLIVLLALGAVAGFSGGFGWFRECRTSHREAFERHVAQLCVEAARSAGAPSNPQAPPPPAPPPRTP